MLLQSAPIWTDPAFAVALSIHVNSWSLVDQNFVWKWPEVQLVSPFLIEQRFCLKFRCQIVFKVLFWPKSIVCVQKVWSFIAKRLPFSDPNMFWKGLEWASSSRCSSANRNLYFQLGSCVWSLHWIAQLLEGYPLLWWTSKGFDMFFFTVLCTQQEKGHQTWHEINWRLWMENCEPQDLEKMYVNRRAATNSVYGCVVHERKLNSLSKWKHPPPQNPTFVLAQILVDTYWNNGFWFWGAFLVPQGGSI